MSGFAKELLQPLHGEFPILTWTVAYNAFLLLLSLIGLAVDSRIIAGINPWIKPLKFEMSILAFLLTAGWMLLNLAAPAGSKQWIAAGISVAMAVEITLVVLQAARGVGSHFNNSTALNGAIFGVMGIVIAANTLLAGWLLLLSFGEQPHLEPAIVWGIRLGLVVFLLASAQGFLIVQNNAHTVGAPDGGPGLFFVNWSTRFGDLRIAHFIGLHAIQLLPLLGWLLSRGDRGAGTGAVVAAFAVWTALFVWTLRMALAGKPLLRL